MKEFRLSIGMTQKEFAGYFGLPIRSLQQWEQGRRNPPPYLLTLLERIWEQDEILNGLIEKTTN